MKAFIETDVQQRLDRASHSRSHHVKAPERGSWVYIHRRNRIGKRWVEGPGVVIMVEGTSAWVIVRGELWKVSLENLRLATNEENKGLELVEQMIPSLKEEIRH